MKRILLSIILTISFAAKAQRQDPIINLENFDKQRVHWGYFLGLNTYGFRFQYKVQPNPEIDVKNTPGFNVGLIGNLRLHEYFDLRFEPGVYFNQRDLTFPGFTEQYQSFRDVKSTYIHFPLLLKFSAKRINNFKPYLIGGMGTALNLSSNAKVLDDNTQGVFRMTKWTNFYELGFGVDFYLEYFKFSPSIRGVFSLNNELIPDKDPNSPWTGNISEMKSRGIFLNFAFH